MRYVTAGESHGPALVAVVSGVPAGVPVDAMAIDTDLARRQVGYGRGGRMAIERDVARILSGMRFGHTIGSPVALLIENRDWENWTDVMSPTGEPTDRMRVTQPRPGHADLGGVLKTRAEDVRDILERASARETAARVAAGAIAKALLAQLGVTVRSYVQRIGPASMPEELPPAIDWAAVEASDVRCPEPVVAAAMRQAIDDAREQGESLGGVIVVVAEGLVPGLGGYAEAGDRLDARLAAAVLSIPAFKGVEIGEAFDNAARPGSQVHDAIRWEQGRGHVRDTNRAGGLEGGMTNGERLLVRGAMKPIPTLMCPLASVDILTHEPVDASKERSDVCAVPAAGVVAEAEVALVLATAYADKFGGDALEDMAQSLAAYRERISR